MLSNHARLVLDHEINFVLEDDDVLESHDVDRNEMFSRLRLGIALVSCHEKKSCVHNCSTSQHRRHEGIVTWAVDEGDMPRQDEHRVAVLALALVSLSRVERLVLLRGFAHRTLVELGVGIAQLDGDVSQFLAEETDSVRA